MPYRSDFYIANNIIGYTGNLYFFPTVYFFDPHTYCFGRITQRHPNSSLVGRTIVRKAMDYSIQNDGLAGHAQEYYNGKVSHKSRHSFHEVKTWRVRMQLSAAIYLFPSMKRKF